MDSFIEALYGQSEETIPEEYDWFAPLLGDWEFEYKDKFIDGDRSRPQRQLKGEWIFRRVLNGIGIEEIRSEIKYLKEIHSLALGIAENTKGECLLQALQIAFEDKRKNGQPEKALIDAESAIF